MPAGVSSCPRKSAGPGAMRPGPTGAVADDGARTRGRSGLSSARGCTPRLLGRNTHRVLLLPVARRSPGTQPKPNSPRALVRPALACQPVVRGTGTSDRAGRIATTRRSVDAHPAGFRVSDGLHAGPVDG